MNIKRMLLLVRHKLHWEDFMIKVVENGEAYGFCTECGWRSEGIRSPLSPRVRSHVAGDPKRHVITRPKLVKFEKRAK